MAKCCVEAVTAENLTNRRTGAKNTNRCMRTSKARIDPLGAQYVFAAISQPV